MFSFRTTSFQEQDDLNLRKGKVALLCDSNCWHPEAGEYLFESLNKRGVLKKIVTTEVDLFKELYDEVEHVELDVENRTSVKRLIWDIDALVIDIQDIGCRNSNIPNILMKLFMHLKKLNADLPVFIIDRINPMGRQIEGTYNGLALHRHGLTIGELANLFHGEIFAKFPLHIISYTASKGYRELLPWSICSSNNNSNPFTSYFYTGQSLWEGTNVNPGIGTLRPYEQFGAPFINKLSAYNQEHNYLNWNDSTHPIYDPSVFIRWTSYSLPTTIERHYGFQLLPIPGSQYHSLAHNLRIMHFVKTNCSEFKIIDTMEKVAGDTMILEYLDSLVSWEEIKEKIKIEEQKWIRKVKKALLYEEPLYRCK